MNIERLRKIILYSEKNREEISYLVRKFCSFAEIEYDNERNTYYFKKSFDIQLKIKI